MIEDKSYTKDLKKWKDIFEKRIAWIDQQLKEIEEMDKIPYDNSLNEDTDKRGNK